MLAKVKKNESLFRAICIDAKDNTYSFKNIKFYMYYYYLYEILNLVLYVFVSTVD